MLVYSPIRVLFGKSQNKHMAATVAVYFHPARTAGSMYESIFFVALSLLFSLLMVTASMTVSKILFISDLPYLAYAIDIVVFVGFGLGFVAFIKQRIGKPTFNTACSVAAMFLVTTLTKEGNVQAGIISFDRVLQSFTLVLSGATISAIVSFALWPKSAVDATKDELNQAMNLSAKMVKHLTKKFIECENIEHSSEFTELKAEVNSSYQRLGKNLGDAAYELLLVGKETEYKALEKLTDSSKRLSLLFNGLGSSVLTQWSLLEEELEACSAESNGAGQVATVGKVFANYSSMTDENAVHDFFGVSPIAEEEEASSRPVSKNSATALFKQFMKSMRPTMVEYSNLLENTMEELPFSAKSPYTVTFNRSRATAFADVLHRYSVTREKSLYRIYKQDNFVYDTDFDSIANKEAEAASCGNFSYILEDIGNGLTEFMRDLEAYQDVATDKSQPRTFSWMKGGLGDGTKKARPTSGSIFVDVTRHELSSRFNSNNRGGGDAPQPGLALRVWRSLRAFRRPDVQFGIKVGAGAAVFALPAFLPSLRPVFQSWRGEWGLITFVIIMNKSMGGTANTVPIRILGTFMGAFLAFCFWTLFPENAVVLAVTGGLLSVVCFWIILQWQSKNMFGRFILLTFNLTVLYSYSLSVSDNDDDENTAQLIVRDIAFHRFVSVCAGVIWALLVSAFVLPNSARRKLKRGLSILWLQMGLVWKADALQTYPRRGSSEYRFTGIQGENAMQLAMIELRGLLENAPNELRLKGPFPYEEYSALLARTQQILDVFQDISVLIAKDPKPSSRELEIIEYTAVERAELCNRIFLNLYLVSSAMRLGFPLPNKMPSTEHAIDRMLAKLNDYRAAAIKGPRPGLDRRESMAEIDEYVDHAYVEDFILFYSYILATIAITEQLAELTMYIQQLFGIIEEEMFEV